MDLRAMVIDATTGEVLGDVSGAWGDEISHADVSGAHGAIVPENKRFDDDDGFGVETMKLKTLDDGSDYKGYIYAIMGHRAPPHVIGGVDEPELAYTGAKLIVKYGGAPVRTYAMPQGPLVGLTKNGNR